MIIMSLDPERALEHLRRLAPKRPTCDECGDASWIPPLAHVREALLESMTSESNDMFVLDGEVWCQYQGMVHGDDGPGSYCTDGHWHPLSMDGCTTCPGPHLPIYTTEET